MVRRFSFLSHSPLIWLLIAGAIHTLAWLIVVPPFQGPDDREHFAYVQYLAETGKAPSMDATNISPQSAEVSLALAEFNLYTLIGIPTERPGWTEVNRKSWQERTKSLTKSERSNGPGPNPASQNPPLYYLYEAIPYKLFASSNLLMRITAMRIANIFLYLATITLVWLIAKEVFSKIWLQTFATAVVVLHPKLGSLVGGTINPDILLVTIWAAFILTSMRLLKSYPSTKKIFALFLLSSASICTHGRGLAIIPALCFVILVSYVQHRQKLGTVIKQLLPGLVGALIPIFVYKIYFIKGNSAYAGSLDSGKIPLSAIDFVSYVWQFYFPQISIFSNKFSTPYGFREVFINSFYGKFISFDVVYPSIITDFLGLFSIIGLLTLYTIIARDGFRKLKNHWEYTGLLAVLTTSLLLVLHLTSYQSFRQFGDPVITGRYLLPLIPVFAISVAFTVGELPDKIGKFTVLFILSFGVMLCLSAVGLTALRFYV